MSKVIDGKLYLTFNEMVDCGFSENYLRKAKSTGTKGYGFINDPEDKRKVLIEYEALKDEHKSKVNARYGNPYERQAKQPIRDLIKWDHKAEEFYLAHRYANGDMMQPLPISHVKKYAGAASFLNMLKHVTEDKKALKDLLKLNIEQFYNHAMEIIASDGYDLPTSYRRLLAKRKEYETLGYGSLIDWRFGNKIAAKVNDEVAESELMKMISNHNQFDDVFIAMQYNTWARGTGRKEITAATVGVRRRANEQDIVMEREGNAALKNKYLTQAKGIRPSAPLLLVESDDNVADYLYNDPENPRAEKRITSYVVTDSYNDYPLGKAYAVSGTLNEGQTILMIKAAYLDAMYYIRSITGAWYLPFEVKTDNWAISSLEPFYKSMAKWAKTPVGSKNRGYLEQFFGSPHWKRCLKISTPDNNGVAINYSGNNLSAKYRGVNMEVLARNKKNRPMIGNEATAQIENFFYRLRHLPQSNGVSKHDQWLEAFNNMPEERKRRITDEQFLLKFGIEHNPGVGKVNRISNRGVEPQINGVKYSYNLKEWRQHEGKAVKIIYDPYDMSRVLVTDYDKVRMIGQEPNYSPRAMADAHLNSRTYLNAYLNEKRDAVDGIADKIEKRDRILKDAGVDYEAILIGGNMLKSIKQPAEEKVMQRMIEGKTEHDYFLDQM